MNLREKLVKAEACKSGIKYYLDNQEKIDKMIASGKILVNNQNEYDNFSWAIDEKIIKVKELKYEDSDGSWSKATYDKNSSKIKYKSSTGYWNKWTYDKNGNEIKYEKSDGYWSKSTYDKNGNQVKYEKSDGYWGKTTYNKNGNQIKFEDSDGYSKEFTHG